VSKAGHGCDYEPNAATTCSGMCDFLGKPSIDDFNSKFISQFVFQKPSLMESITRNELKLNSMV
jgi:hypothetical protein